MLKYLEDKWTRDLAVLVTIWFIVVFVAGIGLIVGADAFSGL